MWIQCSSDGSIRKNPAKIGHTYDSVRDAFISLKPFPSWTLKESSCRWNPPVARPNDGELYKWNEDAQAWGEV